MANSFTAAGVPTTMTLSGIATIENGDQTSAAIPNSGRAVVRLGFPTITSTTLTFQVQAYPATGTVAAASFRSLVDKDGNAISYTIGSNKIVTIPELSGCAAFKLVMGSDEATTRSIEVTSRGDQPVVSPTEIDVDIESGATITANQGTAAAASSAWPTYPVPQNAAAAAPSNATVVAYATSGVIKASPGTLYGMAGYSVGAQFIQLFDSATVPADASVPVAIIAVPATGNFSYNPGIYGRRFATGIAWSRSSTGPTKTIGGGAADVWSDSQYA